MRIPLRLSYLTLSAAVLFTVVTAFTSGDDPRIAHRIVDPHTERITFHWKDEAGQLFGHIGGLERWCTTHGKVLRFAMNGGMYDPEHRPVGLYIENGERLAKLSTSTTGTGNFSMQPNGVFGLAADGKAFVCTTAGFADQRNVAYATQSGPMLVVDGAVNTLFKPGSKNLHIRNGVGVLPDGRVVFAISRKPVNFHDFASWFLAQGCRNALYLDGSVSRAFIPEQGLQQRNGDLAVLIAVIGTP